MALLLSLFWTVDIQPPELQGSSAGRQFWHDIGLMLQHLLSESAGLCNPERMTMHLHLREMGFLGSRQQ